MNGEYYNGKNASKFYNIELSKFENWAKESGINNKKINGEDHYILDSTKITLDAFSKKIMKLINKPITKDIKINKEFWCDDAKEASKSLYYKTGKKRRKLKGFYKKESWISVRRPKEKWTETHTILLNRLRNQRIQNDEIDNCKKIRIYPNKEQRNLFKKCFDATRYFYNKCVAFGNKKYEERKIEIGNLAKEGCVHFNPDKSKLKTPDNKKQCKLTLSEHNKYFCEKHKNETIDWKTTTSNISLRNRLMINNSDLTENDKWQAEVPDSVKDQAFISYSHAYKAALSLKKKGIIKSFRLKFKSKKCLRHVIGIRKTAINKNSEIFVRRLRKENRKLKTKNNRKIRPTRDFKILLTKPGFYYLCLPRKCKVKNANQTQSIIALDPGIRTFQTFYSPDGTHGKIGDGTTYRIKKYYKKLDKLASVREARKKLNGNVRGIDRRCYLLRNKIKNIVDDLHWKTASFLCKNYRVILIPVFSVSEMVKKINKCRARPIPKITVRSMLSLSFYKFRMRLMYKASCYFNTKVITCNESYTSKTCGLCGKLDLDLGKSKIYKCKDCKIPLDRDIHAARNIILKYLSN